MFIALSCFSILRSGGVLCVVSPNSSFAPIELGINFGSRNTWHSSGARMIGTDVL